MLIHIEEDSGKFHSNKFNLQDTQIIRSTLLDQDARAEDKNQAFSALVWSKFDHFHRLLSKLSPTVETPLPLQDSKCKYCTKLVATPWAMSRLCDNRLARQKHIMLGTATRVEISRLLIFRFDLALSTLTSSVDQRSCVSAGRLAGGQFLRSN